MDPEGKTVRIGKRHLDGGDPCVRAGWGDHDLFREWQKISFLIALVTRRDELPALNY